MITCEHCGQADCGGYNVCLPKENELLRQKLTESRSLVRDYFEVVSGRWKGYAQTMRTRYPWIETPDEWG